MANLSGLASLSSSRWSSALRRMYLRVAAFLGAIEIFFSTLPLLPTVAQDVPVLDVTDGVGVGLADVGGGCVFERCGIVIMVGGELDAWDTVGPGVVEEMPFG